ncbi:hypothetical protein G6O67_000796 [Ophiocordyceps sinensis]|uniref:Uncharacterized protein n=1 Tax=Ophiocordyceps sinensis TaxID=72228 RepID=A0A8H4PZZ1_9HYPO|nr:hypothetical protein G6O67_000796 [Ophiocordyceps sinensis]
MLCSSLHIQAHRLHRPSWLGSVSKSLPPAHIRLIRLPRPPELNHGEIEQPETSSSRSTQAPLRVFTHLCSILFGHTSTVDDRPPALASRLVTAVPQRVSPASSS